MRLRRLLERGCLVAAVLLIATWPFAGYYSSVGFEFEQRTDGGLDGVYWRIRWPSDGSLVFARIVEQTPDVDTPADSFDIGGTLLRQSRATGAQGWWQEHGFWWLDFDAREAKPPGIVATADRAFVIGLPQWLWLLLAGGAWISLRALNRGCRRRRAPLPDCPTP